MAALDGWPMATSTGRARPSRPIAIVPHLPSTPEVIVFDAADGRARVPAPEGVRAHHVATSTELAGAIRSLRRGVVAIASPPATTEDIETVARARSRREALRVLLVNDGAEAGERLTALSLGFDDAVPDTVAPDELRGRIRLLIDRTRVDARDRLPVGADTELDLTARALRREGRLVRLRPMEFRLLEELARHPGRPLTREWLLRRVWGSHELDGSRTVDVHVRWLRAKVERDPERPEHLLTVRGVGYQLEVGAGASEVG